LPRRLQHNVIYSENNIIVNKLDMKLTVEICYTHLGNMLQMLLMNVDVVVL